MTAVRSLPSLLRENVQDALIQDLPSLRNLHMVSVAVVVIMANEDAALLKTLVAKAREIVMDLKMADYMMVMRDVEETLCVETTIVKSLDLTIMRRTTAVKNLLYIIIIQVFRDAEVVMMEVEAVVLLRTHAMRVKETVMDQMTEDPMRCAKENLCVATTTVRNLGLFIMRKMTAVRSLSYLLRLLMGTGHHGKIGDHVLGRVVVV